MAICLRFLPSGSASHPPCGYGSRWSPIMWIRADPDPHCQRYSDTKSAGGSGESWIHLDVACVFRSVLTRAELEALPLDNHLKEDVAKGKVRILLYIGFYFTATRTYCSELRIFIYIVHYRYGPLCIHCTVLVPVHIIISTDCRNIYCIPAKHNLSNLTAAITVCPSKLFILLHCYIYCTVCPHKYLFCLTATQYILYTVCPKKLFIQLDCFVDCTSTLYTV